MCKQIVHTHTQRERERERERETRVILHFKRNLMKINVNV